MASRGNERSPDFKEHIIYLHKNLLSSNNVLSNLGKNGKKSSQVGGAQKRSGRPCKLTANCICYIMRSMDENKKISGACC